MTLKELSKIILESNKIGLTFHTSPDGDAIGSALGLLNGLREMGKDVYIISREVIQDNLSFLSLGSEIDGKTTEPVKETDLVIVLDCGNKERICADIDAYDGPVMNIDHHISNDSYGKYNFVDSTAAATAEIVYLLLKEFNFEFNIVSDVFEKIGSCLYTSLVTDTGSFRHSNVTKRTFDIAGELISCGVKNDKIHNELFGNKPFNKVKLIGEALNNLELLIDNKVTIMVLTMETLEHFGMTNVDTSDIINMALNIDGVEVSVVIKETGDGVKASLRSKNDIDVRKIAEVFGGGGHVKASGLKINGISVKEAKNRIIEEIEKEIKL